MFLAFVATLIIRIPMMFVNTVEKVMPADPSQTKKASRLLQPPTPIQRANNWPTLEVQKTTLEDMCPAEENGEEDYYNETAPIMDQGLDTGGDWDDGAFDDGVAAADDDLDFGDDDGMGWGDELDELGDFGEPEHAKEQVDEMAGFQEMSDDAAFQMPTAGRPAAGCWVANSSLAADHMAAGGAASAMQLLNRQIAASEFAVLKDSMIGCYLGSMLSVPGES